MKRFVAALLILAWPAAAQQVAVYSGTGSTPSGAPQVRVSVGDLTLGTAGASSYSVAASSASALK